MDSRRYLRLAAMCACAASLTQGGIAFIDSFKNVTYQQTGNGNTLTATGGFFSADLNTSAFNPYSLVGMTYPGPASSLNIPQISTTEYTYQSSQFATQAAMDVAFPLGTYSFAGTNGAVMDTASYAYLADDYSSSVPYLTGTDYASLQGVNSGQAITFHLNPFLTGTTASHSYITFAIFDETSGKVVDDVFPISPGTTSLTFGANTFAANHQFDYEIDFSNRDLVANPGSTNQAQLGFDIRTDGLFSTATPEPSTTLLIGLGVIGLAALRRLR